MIWHTRNHAKLLKSIDNFVLVRTILDVVRRSGQNSKLSIQDTMVDLRILKVIGISTRLGKATEYK